jgi:hypothetical protein
MVPQKNKWQDLNIDNNDKQKIMIGAKLMGLINYAFLSNPTACN